MPLAATALSGTTAAGLNPERDETALLPDDPENLRPYKFIGFGDIHGPKPYKFIGFGDVHGPKPCKFIGFGDIQVRVSESGT